MLRKEFLSPSWPTSLLMWETRRRWKNEFGLTVPSVFCFSYLPSFLSFFLSLTDWRHVGPLRLYLFRWDPQTNPCLFTSTRAYWIRDSISYLFFFFFQNFYYASFFILYQFLNMRVIWHFKRSYSNRVNHWVIYFVYYQVI